MDAKINGSIYQKIINNYQKPIILKKDLKINKKEYLNNKKTIDSLQSKIIYVNKKTSNIINNQNQNDLSSDTKSITTNSERTFTPFQIPAKQEKNGIKSLLSDSNRINPICNGLPNNQKIKRKNNQSVNNEINKINSKTIEDIETVPVPNKKDKDKNGEFLSNTIQRLKKLQTNINNINTNGNYENNNNILISNYNESVNDEPKRKKQYSLNYNKDANSVSKINKGKYKQKNDEMEYDYIYNSNKINERKKTFIRENINSKELSKIIQENCNINFHRKINNYMDCNKNNNSVVYNNYKLQNITGNNNINNSIECNCIFKENYNRDKEELKEEFFHINKTYDEEDNNDSLIKNINNKSNINKNAALNNNIQKKKLKELQQKLDIYIKKLHEMENIQDNNLELKKKNENLQRSLGTEKKKNEIYLLQIEELQNINFDYNKKIEQLEEKIRANKEENNIIDSEKNEKNKNLEIQYKIILEKNNKLSNEIYSLNKEIKELKEIKNKYNILIKEHGNLLKTESLFNELKIKYDICQNNIKNLTDELNQLKTNFKKKNEEIEVLNLEKNELKNNEKLLEEINNLKILNESLINKNKELIINRNELSIISSPNDNCIKEKRKNKGLEIQSNINNISFLTIKNNILSISSNI